MKIPLAAAIILVAAAARAEDLETLTHKVYKNIKITRTEPDGIVVQHSAGIVKIPFDELPDELRAKFPYDPAAAKEFAKKTAQQQAELAISNLKTKQRIEKERRDGEQRREAERTLTRAMEALPEITIRAVVKPISYGETETTARIYPAYKTKVGEHWDGLHNIPDYKWLWSTDDSFVGVIAEQMSHAYEAGDQVIAVLYKIGHTEDSSRNPRFTTDPEKAVRFMAGLPID